MLDSLKKFFRFFKSDIGIDLGTSTTLIYLKDEGIVLEEPSVIAVDKYNGEPVAVGKEAHKMLERAPKEYLVKKPMKDGVIADLDLAQSMLYLFLKKVFKSYFISKPRVLVAVPSGITEVAKKAVKDTLESIGAKEVHLVTEPIAAAVGMDLPIREPVGNAVIDIGGGTTEIAVISLGKIVAHQSLRVAGDAMDYAIRDYIKKTYKVLISLKTAEEIKKKIGNLIPNFSKDYQEKEMEIHGKTFDGIPTSINIKESDVRKALKEPISKIIEGIKKTFEETPEDLIKDIINRGIYIAGGGALLKGLAEIIREEISIPTKIADDPQKCVVLGTGKMIEQINEYKELFIKPRKLYLE